MTTEDRRYEPKPRRKPMRRGLKVGIALGTVFAVAILSTLGALWFHAPPTASLSAEMVRVSGACCQAHAGPSDTGTRSIGDTNPWVMFRIDPLGKVNAVHDGQADLQYTITRVDEPDSTQGSSKSSNHDKTYSETNLKVGDVLVHGPVTIEVVAIYDEFFDRNDAVDLRVTFDQSRLIEAP